MTEMTQKDKQLLLRDLCARLPYKPKIKVLSLWNENKEAEEDIVDSVYCVMSDGYINTETIDSDIPLDNIVLYLRPMSSMTEEEYAEYVRLVYEGYAHDTVNYLNSIHVDYRNLIEKGLAIKAPKGMYEK